MINRKYELVSAEGEELKSEEILKNFKLREFYFLFLIIFKLFN